MTTTPLLVEEGLGVVHKPPPQLYYFIKATREDKKIVPFGEGWQGGGRGLDPPSPYKIRALRTGSGTQYAESWAYSRCGVTIRLGIFIRRDIMRLLSSGVNFFPVALRQAQGDN